MRNENLVDKCFAAFLICGCATFIVLIAYLIWSMVTGNVG